MPWGKRAQAVIDEQERATELSAEEIERLRKEGLMEEADLDDRGAARPVTKIPDFDYVSECVRDFAARHDVQSMADPAMIAVVEEILDQPADPSHATSCKVTRIAAALTELGRYLGKPDGYEE